MIIIREEKEWTYRSFINEKPLEEYTKEEQDIMFNNMIIKAVHSIGMRFTKEEENIPMELPKLK